MVGSPYLTRLWKDCASIALYDGKPLNRSMRTGGLGLPGEVCGVWVTVIRPENLRHLDS
jgi:hypothetical protein